MFRVIIKLPLALTIVSGYLAVSLIYGLFLRGERLRRARIYLMAFACRQMLRVMGIQVQYENLRPYALSNCLIVSNHLSYLDVIIMVARFPVAFITSNEVRDTFLLGWLCKAGASLFVERRNRNFLSSEVEKIAAVLRGGIPIAVFPEATTSDGTQLLPFRASLLKAAELAPADIVPFVFNYLSIDGEAPNLQNRDSVYYYGDMTFFPHLLRLLRVRRIRVKLTQLDTLFVDNLKDRKQLADAAFQVIEKAYIPIA